MCMCARAGRIRYVYYCRVTLHLIVSEHPTYLIRPYVLQVWLCTPGGVCPQERISFVPRKYQIRGQSNDT